LKTKYIIVYDYFTRDGWGRDVRGTGVSDLYYDTYDEAIKDIENIKKGDLFFDIKNVRIKSLQKKK
jgi:hypothetical protein